MSYFGMIVVARPPVDLPWVEGIEAFGHVHTYLRDCGDGWQLLETIGEAPDLSEATPRLAATLGGPVFAAYVVATSCADVGVAIPDRPASAFHLVPLDGPCPMEAHAAPVPPRAAESVLADLLAWSAAAGLPARPDDLRAVLGYDPDAQLGLDAVFELILALGVPKIGRVRQHSFDALNSAPFNEFYGLRGRPRYGMDEPFEELERDIWRAVYLPDPDRAGLAARAIWIKAAYDAARDGRPPPPMATPPEIDEIVADVRRPGMSDWELYVANDHSTVTDG